MRFFMHEGHENGFDLISNDFVSTYAVSQKVIVTNPLSSSPRQRFKQDREILDRHIASMEHELCTLKRYRNLKAPINATLLPEIMSRVFFHVKNITCHDPDQLGGLYTRASSSRISWVQSITHVCDYWRSIAISDPTLWIDGFPNNITGVQVFLKRSKNLPIVLDMRFTDCIRRYSSFRSLILSHMARVEKLEMKIYESDIGNMLDLLDIDMPHLRQLDICLLEPPGRGSFATMPRPAISLPRPGNLNHVCYLRLKFYGFSWDQVELANLTHLEVTGDSNQIHDASVAQMVDVLKRSPGLRTLALTNLVCDDRQNQNTTTTEISLHFLESLSLCQTGIAFTKLLVLYAVLPKLKNISLEVSTNNEPTVASILASATRHLRHDHPKNLAFAFADPNDDASTYECKYVNGSSLWFLNQTRLEHVKFSQMVLLCLEESDLTILEGLHCIINGDPTIEWWTQIFNKTIGLKKLAIEGPFNPNSLLSALTPEENGLIITKENSAPAKNKDSPSTPESSSSLSSSESPLTSLDAKESSISLLPSLTSLIFENIFFVPHSHLHNRPFAGELIKLLELCLAQRAAHGSRLHELKVPQTKVELDNSGVNIQQYVDCMSYVIYASSVDSDSDLSLDDDD